MQLHELKPTKFNRDKKTRIGRGGKRGTYSGRGQKGQKSRSGHRIRPAERDFIQRLPKLRGSGNRIFSVMQKAPVINVGDLEKLLNNTDKANVNTLGKVKILSSGMVARPFIVKGLKLSKSARKKIESAGGKIL